MSINRRTAITVRTIGIASAAAALTLGLAGSAFACDIGEFTPSAGCDNTGHGYINVLDQDVSHTPVNITLKQGSTVLGTKIGVVGSKTGVTVTFAVDWQPSTAYTVDVKQTAGPNVGTKDVTTPEQACALPTQSPTPTASTTTTSTAVPTTTTSATAAQPTTPSDTSSSAAAVAAGNAPSPAAGGGQKLAETGGGSNTGMIAGIAGAFVVVGGGAVFALRRRTATARH